jgi:CheY-like chemotaxis protein
MGVADVIDRVWAGTTFEARTIPGQHTVLIVRDHDKQSEYLDSVCEFLNVGVEHATTTDDLASMLIGLRPMAVIADLDGAVQDGCHVMKIAAGYDRSLPILLLTNNDPALLGAVDAVAEVWGMKRVSTASTAAEIGTLVDFICRASRNAGKSGLMRI